MRKKLALILLAALWVLLTGCKTNPATPEPPEPAPIPEPQSLQEPPQEEKNQEPPQEEKNDAPELDGIAAQYVGIWRDTVCSDGQCRMQITWADSVYSIEIHRDGGEGKNSRWLYTGTYDEIWEGIDYIGSRYEEMTQEDGTTGQSAVLEEATGLIYLDEDGALLWEDTFEHQGDGLRFLRED